MTQQYIYLDPFIQEEQNTEISVLQSNTIISYIEDNDNSIISTLQVSEAALEQTITAVSITSNSLVTLDNELEIFIGGNLVISVNSSLLFGDINLDREIPNIVSIDSTTNIGVTNVIPNVDVESITSTTVFSTDHEILNFIQLDSFVSTSFGVPRFNLFLGLESIQQVNTFEENVLVLFVGQQGANLLEIEPTTSFGTPSFGGFVQRVLIFKDDNIAKIGTADAVEVVNGIVMNPSSLNSSSATSGQSTLPDSPEGFILVTINGTNYKIPYYNE